MDFDLDDEQQLILESVERLLAKHAGPARAIELEGDGVNDAVGLRRSGADGPSQTVVGRRRWSEKIRRGPSMGVWWIPFEEYTPARRWRAAAKSKGNSGLPLA